MAYTWRDDANGFSPGRLDFFIYSDSVMGVDKHYLLYTGEMTADQLAAYGLQADDSAAASDHIPLVVDIVFGMP
ncbi:MAG: hypothetical protein GY796_31315 [Chloroflexi bacterium]|nr:hypothetical protein [Chloroflexota bacterium]